HLEFASDRYDVDPVDDEKMEKEKEKETSKLAMVIGIGAIGVLSFLVSKLIFTLTPAIVANLFSDWISSNTGQVLLEVLFKFMLFTVIVGIFVYMFVAADPLWWRIVNRIILIPVVIGLSFEVLQITNKVRHVPVLKVLGYPGLWLQLLTTKSPDDEQVEVALHSFQKVLENDADKQQLEAVDHPIAQG